MIVHMDINDEEALFCDECGERLSNDAWLVIEEGNVDSTLCSSCHHTGGTRA